MPVTKVGTDASADEDQPAASRNYLSQTIKIGG